MKYKFTRPALLAALMAVSGAASATSLTWNFQNPDVGYPHWGTSHTFDTNPVATGNFITAYGYDATSTPGDLYSKKSGTFGETGLGLFNSDKEGDFEINPGASIVFGLNTALSKTYTITLGSLQDYGATAKAENANIYECKTSTCAASVLLGNISGPPIVRSATFTLDPGFSYLEVLDAPAGGGQDVLVDSISVPSVPEPATLGMLGLGLAGLGFMRRRKVN
jgi:hypothetical protein